MKTDFNPSSFNRLHIGQTVKVFMGAGWAKGTVTAVTSRSATVQIDRRSVCCYDTRNIRV